MPNQLTPRLWPNEVYNRGEGAKAAFERQGEKIKSKTVTEPAQGTRKKSGQNANPSTRQTSVSLSYGISKRRSALKINSPTRPLRAEP